MYTHFYGFSENPFNITPDPKFLFLTENYQKALDAVLYGIRERKGFVSISGEAGTGKTTILHHLLNTLVWNVKTVFIAHSAVTPKQLLKEIAQKICLAPGEQSNISLIRRLNEHLLAALPQDGNLAVLIDEAQDLSLDSMEELRILSNLETSDSKLIQVVFAGEPELETKLNSQKLRQFKQRVAIRSQIRPLTAEESGQYIGHRLRLVGRTPGEVFHPEAESLIVRHAGGIPRTINLLCDHALLIGYRKKESRIPADTVKEVLADRGMFSEEKKENIPALGTGRSSSAKKRVRKSSGKTLYFGIPGAMALILVLLAAGGHLKFPSKNTNLKFSENYAVAIPQGVPTADPILADPPIPSGVPGEKKMLEATAPVEPEKPSAPLSPAGDRNWETRSTTVDRGETLFSVLRRQYGQANTTLLDFVILANPQISDPHRLSPGARIRVPALSEEGLVQPSSRGEFRIHLATFAKMELAEKFKELPLLEGRALRIEGFRAYPSETWYRVFAGGYKSREEALKDVKNLRGKRVLPLFSAGTQLSSWKAGT